MKVLLKTICESAFTAKESGNLNIIGIFENIVAGGFPTVQPRMSFVFIVEGNPGESFRCSFHVEDSSGTLVLPSQSKEFVTGTNGKLNLILNIVGIKFDKEGVYKAVVNIGKEREELPFNVLPSNR